MVNRSVRASRLERTRALPGDDLIPESIGSLTHAITIRRPRQEVWPWLVQMGAGSRAGWYSYDLIDNGRQRSADHIVPALQIIAVGELVPAVPGATDGFHVLTFETERYLVLGWRPTPDAAPVMTWAFVLEERAAEGTRLIVRARSGRGYPFYGLPPSIGMPFVRFGHFIMQRKQLLGIARRAESQAPADGMPERSTAAECSSPARSSRLSSDPTTCAAPPVPTMAGSESARPFRPSASSCTRDTVSARFSLRSRAFRSGHQGGRRVA